MLNIKQDVDGKGCKTGEFMATSNILIEPRIQYIFDRKIKNSSKGPCIPKSAEDVEQCLIKLFNAKGLSGIEITNVARMAGGASKEQFSFQLICNEEPRSVKLVLRMDPIEGIVETCRLREGELLSALQGVVPVPEVFAIDPEGEFLGRPGLICTFVEGVTAAPSDEGSGVTGIGSTYGKYAKILAPQFIDHLVEFHSWREWKDKDLSNFVVPKKNSIEAALYQVNQWGLAFKIDKIEPVPTITVAEHWLKENAPICKDPCLVHCDYRIGNFLFSQETGQIVAVLDWELAHFGDFHEDLAWILHRFFGTSGENGEFLVCGLMTREEFLDQYQQKSGRVIDEMTLLYYQVLNAYKCAIMASSLGVKAARDRNNHQELLLSWLAMASGIHINEMIKSIRKYEAHRNT